MPRHYNVISADGHLEIMPEFYTKFLAAKYKDDAPHTFARPDGKEFVRMGEHESDGTLVRRGDLDDDLHVANTNATNFHNPDGTYRPGLGTAAQRLQEQDIDGIDAEFLYTGSGKAIWKNLLPKNPDLYQALHVAYNDWLAKEYNAAAPDRLMGGAIVPETGVEDAIREATRARKMGLTWVQIQNWPNGSGYYAPGDEKFFQAMVDLNMLVSPHSSFAANSPRTGGDVDTLLQHRAAGPAMGVTMFMRHGIFDKSPKTKIYIGETYVSYLPFNYNRMDEHYIRRRHYYGFQMKKLPSDYIRDHMAFSFIQERTAMPLRNYIGLDQLMWGSDFPHNVNTYPHSRTALDEMFMDVPADEKRQVLVGNPCKWFGLDPEKDLTPTPTKI